MIGSFSALDCSATQDTNIGYAFDTLNVLSQDYMSQVPPRYTNYVDYNWMLFTNPKVKDLKLRFDVFDTEAGWDLLYVGSFETLSGNPVTGWRTYNLAGTGQESGVALRFYTDSTVIDRGFVIGDAAVRCGSSGASTTPIISATKRIDGFLLGTNDSVSFRFPTTPNYIYVTLWGQPVGSDFDLYQRGNGSMPTKNVYDRRSATTGQMESIQIPQGAYGSYHYVVVHSYSGGGSFSLRFSEAKGPPNSQLFTRKAGANFNANAGQITIMKDILRRGMRRFFGANEGQIVVTRTDFFNNTGSDCTNCGGSNCDICFRTETGFCGACCENGKIKLFRTAAGIDEWHTPAVLAHEFGHCPGGLPDEYQNHNSAAHGGVCGSDCRCGHSHMCNLIPNQNNWCIEADHKKDPHSHVCTPCSSSDCATNACVCADTNVSAWQNLLNAGKITHAQTTTPDNESYDGFDFGTLVEVP
jgi:hypothetical protein